MDRPLFIGLTILDYAKIKMIRYWYLALEKAFAHDPTTQLSLIMTDTGEYVVTKLLVVVAVAVVAIVVVGVVVKVDTGDR